MRFCDAYKEYKENVPCKNLTRTFIEEETYKILAKSVFY